MSSEESATTAAEFMAQYSKLSVQRQRELLVVMKAINAGKVSEAERAGLLALCEQGSEQWQAMIERLRRRLLLPAMAPVHD